MSTPGARGRTALICGLLLVLLTGCADSGEGPRWEPGAAAPQTAGSSAPQATTAAPAPVTLSATGDIIMGNAPSRLPADDGKGFFDSVTKALAADLVMGNLEEPLTVDTGTGKCGADATDCYQFRVPPSYAAHLRDAGFQVLNIANNHGYDFGAAGYANTQAALEEHGLQHTGPPEQITLTEVGGLTIANVGFSPYFWGNSVVDIAAGKKLVAEAKEQADLVVVQAHMGAEGTDRTRVTFETETFFGENRGNPVAFSRAMVDAGADLIVGHGPHVLRGMEFYKGKLIAYSLGNFAGGGGTLSTRAELGWGGVLRVSLNPDGSWAGGEFRSTYMDGAGLPRMDADARGLQLIERVSGADFPESAPQFGPDGRITPPAS
ncbi:CapA family protein [Melissospora conviva]|uniref:CapA family protein n=1 Tax=Melissospora conviva TaxID=3388432 RepID=UPI003C19DB69